MTSASMTGSSTTSSSSLDSDAWQWKWESVDHIMANPSFSANRKAESIYCNLRDDEDPFPPRDFSVNEYWKPYINTLLLHATDEARPTLAMKSHITDMAKQFIERPRVIGKRKIDDSEEILNDGISGSKLQAASRFRLEDVIHVHDIEFIQRMTLPGSWSDADDIASSKRSRCGPYVSFSEVAQSAQFSSLESELRDALDKMFSRKEFLPPWKADLEPWKSNPEAQTQIVKLRPHIPATVSGVPDLLLYRVGDAHSHELDSKFLLRTSAVRSGGKFVIVNGPRGAGKSRLLLETATFDWSLLLHYTPPESEIEYGSADLSSAIRLLSLRTHCLPDSDKPFDLAISLAPNDTPNITTQEARAIVERWRNNTALTEHMVLVVVLARMVVLEQFYRAWHRYKDRKVAQDSAPASPAAAEPTPADQPTSPARKVTLQEARRMWALLQMRPGLLGGADDDIFLTMMTRLLFIHPDDLKEEISRRLRVWERIHLNLRRVLIDDTQFLSSKWSGLFGSKSGMRTSIAKGVTTLFMETRSRALLYPVLTRVSSLFPQQQLIIAGTGLDAEVVSRLEEDMGGLVEIDRVSVYNDFGGNFSDRQLTDSLNRFFGSGFAERLAPSVKHHVYFWVPGRHLFAMLFIRSLLSGGPSVIPRALNTLVGQLTGFYPIPNVGTLEGMNLRDGPLIPSKRGQRVKLIRETNRITNIEKVFVTWLLNSRKPSGDPEDHKLVATRFGRLVADAGQLASIGTRTDTTENIAAVSMRRLFETDDKEHSTVAYLDRGLSDDNPVIKGFACEDVLVYQLCIILSQAKGVILNEMFDFCYLPPSWANKRAWLIGVFKGHTESGKEPELAQQSLLTRFAWKTNTHDETLNWFRLGKSYALRIPILKPDGLFGPDIILAIKLETGEEVLIVIQSKCWSTKHGGKDVVDAFLKLSPEGFYKSNPNYRTEIVAALKKLFKGPHPDMTNGVQFPPADPNSEYKDENPTLPILRVFAAFKETVNWPDMTKPGKFGRYPLARLSQQFMDTTEEIFPSFKAAAEGARTLNRGKPKRA